MALHTNPLKQGPLYAAEGGLCSGLGPLFPILKRLSFMGSIWLHGGMHMNPLHGFPEWVVAVFEHWHGWLSGGVLAFGLEVGDKLWDWKPNKKAFAVIIGVGLFWSAFSAWRDEHHNTEKVAEEKSSAWSQYGTCAGDLKQKQAEVTGWSTRFTDQIGHMSELQNSVNAQQSTLNSCVVALAKSAPSGPPVVKITDVSFALDVTKNDKGKELRLWEFVVSVDRTVIPFQGTFACEGGVRIAQGRVALPNAIENNFTQFRHPDSKQGYRIEYALPAAWLPDTPLIFVAYEAERPTGCKFVIG
ncbi:MAG: hypothetical protein WAM78_17010 [Candidatus Sulfotelmatobacter sp.]